MPTVKSLKLPSPTDWQEFEQIVLDALSHQWKGSRLAKEGRHGQAQNGVDIFGTDELGRKVGIQCKLHASFRPKDIDEAIMKAMSFEGGMRTLYIVVSSSRDKKLQNYVREVNSNLDGSTFEVAILFWDEIGAIVAGSEELMRAHYPERSAGLDRYNALPHLAASLEILSSVIAQGVGLTTSKQATDPEFIFREADAQNEGIDPMKVWSAGLAAMGLPDGVTMRSFQMGFARELAQQRNREAVAMHAFQALPRAVEDASRRNDNHDSEPDATVDEDWLSMFWDCASKKRNDELRELFGKILAHEITHSGDISPATLHLLATIDSEIAQSIQRLCSISLRNTETGACFLVDVSGTGYNPAPASPDPFDFEIFSEHFMRSEEVGAIARSQQVTFEGHDDGQTFEIGEKIYRLHLERKYSPDDLICIPLTAIGRNFRSILGVLPPRGYDKRLRAFLKTKGAILTLVKSAQGASKH